MVQAGVRQGARCGRRRRWLCVHAFPRTRDQCVCGHILRRHLSGPGVRVGWCRAGPVCEGQAQRLFCRHGPKVGARVLHLQTRHVRPRAQDEPCCPGLCPPGVVCACRVSPGARPAAVGRPLWGGRSTRLPAHRASQGGGDSGDSGHVLGRRGGQGTTGPPTWSSRLEGGCPGPAPAPWEPLASLVAPRISGPTRPFLSLEAVGL